jgi:type I restriction enzyme S subunit
VTLGEVTQQTSNIKWRETTATYQYIDLTSVNRDNHSIVDTIEVAADNAPSRAQKLIRKDDVIFATTRPTLQRFTLIGDDYDGQIASTGYCVLRAKTADVLPKWIYYNIAKTDFNNYVEQNQEGSAYPAITDARVKNFEIPLPPLAEQARIVEILDRFDTLCTDLTSGLPAEIAARQKQYEYYRDRLLTFKEKTA